MEKGDSYRTFHRPPGLPGIEVWDGHIARGDTAGGFFTLYTLSAIVGPISWHYDGAEQEHDGCYTALIEEGRFLPTKAHGEVSFHGLCLAPDVMRRAAEERGHTGTLRFSDGIARSPDIHRMVLAAIATNAGALRQQELVTALLDIVLTDYVERGHPMIDVVAHSAVRVMRDLIHDRFRENLDLDEIAFWAHLNKFHALRAFRRAMGVTPHEYQRGLRVAQAVKMLRDGQKAAQVALAVGFCDQSHMARTMRAITLTTPRQYRSPELAGSTAALLD